MALLQDHFSLKAACSNIITVLSSYHLNNNIMIMCVKECGLGNFIWWAILSVTRSFFSRLNPSRQKTDIVCSKNAKNCASYVHCLQVAVTTPKGGSWGYLYKRSLFTYIITHPAQERLATLLGSTSSAFFEQWCGFFYVPQEPEVLWDGTYGFSSLSEKTRKSNRLQMLSQRQHFLL